MEQDPRPVRVQTPAAGLVRRSVTSLFVANSASFATIGLSYLLYSRLLTPEQFGLYSTALVVGTFGQLLLDGGLKNTIIKAADAPDRRQQGTVVFLMVVSSLLLVGALALGGGPVGDLYPAARHDYRFLAVFGAIYLISYPWLAVPTAFLERRFAYRRVAVIESVGQVLERATPALFLVATPLGMDAFLAGLFLGRAFRVVAVNLAHRAPVHVPTPRQVREVGHLVAEGGWLQLGMGVSQVRDSLHVLVVGPFFGQAWVGYYGWCLQMALIASQAFVQVSARVSVPVFAQSAGFEARWRHCLQQTRLLTILTGPVLVAALLGVPSVNAQLFHGKWEPALAILPLVFARMLPSVATTPVGALVMVHRGGRALAMALSLWTLLEIAGAIGLCLLLGPTGLAWSYAVVVWAGLWLLLRSLAAGPGTAGELPLLVQTAGAILRRPSLGVAVGLAGAAMAALAATGRLAVLPYALVLGLAGAVIAAAYLSEPEVRRYLPFRRPRGGRRLPPQPEPGAKGAGRSG